MIRNTKIEKERSVLKGSEIFVAESLQTYFKKLDKHVYFEEGEDPPDIYFYINNRKVSIEVTNLDENSLTDRRTIDSGYLSFFNKINTEFESLISEGVQFHIIFEHNFNKVKKIDKEFKKYLKQIIKNNEFKMGVNIEDSIDDIKFSISISEISKGETKIVGAITPSFEPQNGSLNDIAFNIMKDRIDDKNNKCQDVKKPIWLALYDNYYDKFTDFETQEHIEFYKDVLKDVVDFGIFDKILIVFRNKDVLDIDVPQ